MSVSTYSVQIYNNSNENQNYLLFQSLPEVSGEATVFSNIFQSSGKIQSGDSSNVNFTMTNQYYAVIGSAPAPLIPGVTVTTGANVPAQLSSASQGGTKAVMTTSGGGQNCSFDNGAQGLESDIMNTFEILTDNSFKLPTPGNLYLGIGAKGPQGVIPVATIQAAPNQKYYFNPVVKYYIATGTYAPGTVVNITDIGLTQECDFTSSANPQVYTQGPDQMYHQGPPTSADAKRSLK